MRKYFAIIFVCLSLSNKLIAQTIADFSFSDSICGNLDVKFINKSSNASSFFWYFSPGSSNQVNPTHTFPAYGSYDITLIAFSGAVADTVIKTLHILPKPNSNISGTSNILCPGDTGYLSAWYNPRYQYRWTPGKWLSDSNIANPITHALITTRYNLLVTDTTTRCSDTSSFVIKVKSCKPPVAEFLFDKPVCGIYDMNFYNISINDYGAVWDFGDGTSPYSDDADTVNHNYGAPGTYRVLLTIFDSLGLYTDTISYLIKLGDLVKAGISASAANLCRGDSARLVGTGGTETLQWLPNLWLSSNSGDTVYASPQANITYKVIAQDNGCSDTFSIDLMVTQFPNFKILADSPCLGSPVTAWCSPLPSKSDSLFWDWNDGNVSSGKRVNHTYGSSGSYNLNLRYTTNGCDTSASHTVKVFPLPKAMFDQNPTDVFIDQPSVQFYNRSQNASTYRWDFGDGNYIYDASVSHQYLDTGTFTVQLVAFNEFGCTDTAYSRFTIRPELIVYVPTGFTPNNQGPKENEKFRIYLNQVLPEFEFTIFNKWGTKVFETTDQNFEWDGSFKDEPCITNSFFWIMRYRISQEKVQHQKGILYLFK